MGVGLSSRVNITTDYGYLISGKYPVTTYFTTLVKLQVYFPLPFNANKPVCLIR